MSKDWADMSALEKLESKVRKAEYDIGIYKQFERSMPKGSPMQINATSAKSKAEKSIKSLKTKISKIK